MRALVPLLMRFFADNWEIYIPGLLKGAAKAFDGTYMVLDASNSPAGQSLPRRVFYKDELWPYGAFSHEGYCSTIWGESCV